MLYGDIGKTHGMGALASKGGRGRALTSLLLTLLAVYGFLTLYVYMSADGMMFYPPPTSDQNTSHQNTSYQDGPDIIKLKAKDGQPVAAIYLENPKSRYTILYSHGNAEDLGTVVYRLREFHAKGFSVLGYDYHGYGKSGGRPSEKTSYMDIHAAYEYLTGPLSVPPERIIVYGYSIGSGPSVELARQRRVGALVLESAIVSAYRVMTVVPVFPFDRYKNVKKIGKVRAPKLIMHGEADSVIPAWHGHKLFEAAQEPKLSLWVSGAEHYNLSEVAGPAYEEALASLVRMMREQAR